jgi:hypothetical protein
MSGPRAIIALLSVRSSMPSEIWATLDASLGHGKAPPWTCPRPIRALDYANFDSLLPRQHPERGRNNPCFTMDGQFDLQTTPSGKKKNDQTELRQRCVISLASRSIEGVLLPNGRRIGRR